MLRRLTDTPAVNRLIAHARGTLAFDVGANGGFVSNILAAHFDQVLAIEPAEESFKHLEKDAVANVIPMNVAASDHDGEQEFRVTRLTQTMGELFTGHSLEHWGPTLMKRTVSCLTLDALALKYGLPDFVKIDTEGHEDKVIDGAHSVFKEHPRFVIEIHSRENGEHIQDYFDGIGIRYAIYRHHMYLPDTPNFLDHYWLADDYRF